MSAGRGGSAVGRAMVFHGPQASLERVEFAVPELRAGEVLVRVAACTLCRSDLHSHAGRRTTPTPTILGHEIVGRIAAFGPSTARIDAQGQPAAVGDRVTWAIVVGCGECFFCANDLPQKCQRLYKYGHEQLAPDRCLGGGLADYVVLTPRTAWLRVPDGISDELAAVASCATATVAAVLRYGGELADRSVLVLGAGVLGLTACAMARSAEARLVMASDVEPACRDRAEAFGATHALGADREQLLANVRAVTDGRGPDVVVELSGASSAVETGLAAVRTGGTLVLAGTVANCQAAPLDPENVVRRMITMRGVHNYHPRDLQAALAFLDGPGENFPFASLVAGEFSLEEADKAFAAAHAQPGVRTVVVP